MIIDSDNPYDYIGKLQFYDILIFACQCMWHLKDWILNDPEFGEKDTKALYEEIHSEKCLLICADLANEIHHVFFQL